MTKALTFKPYSVNAVDFVKASLVTGILNALVCYGVSEEDQEMFEAAGVDVNIHNISPTPAVYSLANWIFSNLSSNKDVFFEIDKYAYTEHDPLDFDSICKFAVENNYSKKLESLAEAITEQILGIGIMTLLEDESTVWIHYLLSDKTKGIFCSEVVWFADEKSEQMQYDFYYSTYADRKELRVALPFTAAAFKFVCFEANRYTLGEQKSFSIAYSKSIPSILCVANVQVLSDLGFAMDYASEHKFIEPKAFFDYGSTHGKPLAMFEDSYHKKAEAFCRVAYGLLTKIQAASEALSQVKSENFYVDNAKSVLMLFDALSNHEKETLAAINNPEVHGKFFSAVDDFVLTALKTVSDFLVRNNVVSDSFDYDTVEQKYKSLPDVSRLEVFSAISMTGTGVDMIEASRFIL